MLGDGHRLLTPARTALALLALVGSGGCGGGAASAARPSAPAVAPAAVVTPAAPLACGATRGLALPAGWPSEVPLPAGLLVTRTERRDGQRLIAYARVPGDFHGVVRFFNASLPAAGFTQSKGEIDPFDAESDFTGSRVQGRWVAGLSPECDGSASVTVLVLPAGADVAQPSALPSSAPPPR